MEDTHSTAWRVGGNEEDKTRRLWAQDEGDEQSPAAMNLNPRMERTLHLVAEWISLTERKELQSACTLVSMKAREKEYEEFLSYQDDQVWKEMSEEWQQYLTEKEESPAV